MSYEERIAKLVERAIETRNVSLHDLIRNEGLQEYEPGTLTILSGCELNNAIVPCKEYMILVRDRYDDTTDSFVAEYAIYEQFDHDGRNLKNALNANAIYRCSYIGEETFENMAAAISYAMKLIYSIKESEDESHDRQ